MRPLLSSLRGGNCRENRGRNRAGNRGVSPLVGFLLVFGFFTLASIGGSIFVVTTLSEAGSGESTQVAEQTMRTVRADMQDLTSGAPYRSTRADVQDGTLRYADPITVRVEADTPNQSMVAETHPRPLVYESENGRVVYVAGAVFRQSGDSAVMETGPDYRISNSQAILSVVNTTDADGSRSVSVSGDSVVHIVGYRWETDSRRFEPTTDTGQRVNATVTLTIESPRTDSWSRWFHDHPRFENVTTTDGAVSAEFETERLLIRSVTVAVGYERSVA